MRGSDLDEDLIPSILDRLHTLETGTPMFATSMTSGRFRIGGTAQLLVDSSGGMSINGSFVGAGGFTWSGPMSLTGTQTVTGTMNVNGPWNLAGTGGITGAVSCTGNWTWTGQLLVNTGGSIQIAGSNSITLGLTGGVPALSFGSGAQVIGSAFGMILKSASGSITLAVSNTNVAIVGNFNVNGNSTVSGTKSFRIPHPTKEGMWLQHGSTESPVSGTEYWGTGTLDAAGEVVVTLPDYFEALNKPEGRVVLVSAIGRPFLIGADAAVDGAFTVYGDAGREFTWCVKAERFGAGFEPESLIEDEG